MTAASQEQAKPIGLAPGVPREAAGQDAAKYGSSNPLVRRLLDGWMTKLREVVGPIDGTVVDVGTGEGFSLERVLNGASGHVSTPPTTAHVVGMEYRSDKAAVAAGRLQKVGMTVGDAGMVPFPDRSADLVLCIEVLEHLPATRPAVAELARITDGRCVVSVPWEPWFRLGNLGRGKNVSRLGNDPEHLHFFNPRRLRQTLEQSFSSVRVVKAFPWLIAEARR